MPDSSFSASDHCSVGFLLSLQTLIRMGLFMPVYGLSCSESTLLALDFVNMGFLMLPRSFLCLDLTLPLFGLVRSGFSPPALDSAQPEPASLSRALI